jgi:hypothetical protein
VRYSQEMVSLTMEDKASLVCCSPFCDVRFPQTGKVKPRRFCSDACRMDAWAIRRLGKLLQDQSDDRILQIIRGGHE